MNMKKCFFLSCMLLMLLATGCKDDNKVSRKDRSAGGTSEILVVTQNDEQWKGMIGDTIQAFFQQEQYGLPQPEPIYKVLQINVSCFSDMFKKHKSILIVEINSQVDSATVVTNENLWAEPQRVVKIIAPNRQSWVQAFEKQKDNIKLLYDKVERERVLTVLRPSTDPKLYDALLKKFGFSLSVPEGFFIAKDEPGFMWLRKEFVKYGVGIIIYTKPYADTTQFEANHLITERDIIVKDHIPGPSEGSFMTTEKTLTPPIVNYVGYFPGGYAAEMRGIWCLVGDYMAGPFISYSFVDRNSGNFVTMEGYVYAPNQDKRDQLLQLQAIMFSLKYKE